MIIYSSKLGDYVLANRPVGSRARARKVEGGYALVGWRSEDGEPPTLEQVEAWTPDPLTDVDIAKQYQQAYQAAEGIIFLLMGRVSTALVVGKHFTPETVNKEGTRFTRYHQAEIEAFKLSGRHPDAGDALYAAVEASAGEFPWLKKEDNILSIFATTLPRNLK